MQNNTSFINNQVIKMIFNMHRFHILFIKSFPGARTNEINHYVLPTLIEENPDAVVIHAGTNNIRSKRGQPEEQNERIAEDIMQIGRTCRQRGVNEVFISAITCRRNKDEMKKVKEINGIVKDM